MLDYAAATGAGKSDILTILESQQIKAKDFSRKLDAKNIEILVELKKFTK